MLILTRRTGEDIVIGNDIRITVTRLRGDKVRLGITAPASVRIDRAEVHDRRQVSKALTPLTRSTRAAITKIQDGCPQPDLVASIGNGSRSEPAYEFGR